jgi:hypothetical protein
MFSFIVGSFFIGSLSILLSFIGYPKLLHNNGIVYVSLWIGILIFNYILFLPKQRQLGKLKKYNEVRSTTKDIVSIFISVLSIIILVIAISQTRNFYI